MKKTNLLLIGMPGCGKTTVGRRAAKRAGLKFLDMDMEIERREKKTIPELFEKGEDNFRAAETRCAKSIASLEHTIISAGGGLVTREENIEALRESSLIVFIDRSVDNLLGTRGISNYRPLLKDDRNRIIRLYDERIDLYRKYADVTVTNNGKRENCVKKVAAIAEKTCF